MRRQAIERVRDGILNWVGEHLSFFDPFLAAQEPSSRAVRNDRFFSGAFQSVSFESCRWTAYVQLAQSCMVLKWSQDSGCDRRLEEILSFLSRLASRPCLWEVLERNPRLFPSFLKVHVALEQCGAEPPMSRPVLERMLASGYPLSVERPSYQQIELRSWLNLGGFDSRRLSLKTLLGYSALAKVGSRSNLFLCEPALVTQIVLDLTQYGRRRLEATSPARLQSLRWELGNHLGLAVMEREWRLAGNLLVACRCLGWQPPGFYEAAREALNRAQRTDGSIPSSAWSDEHSRNLEEERRRAYDFEHNWQPTLAVGVAFG